MEQSAVNGALYGLLMGVLFAAADAIAWTPLWVLFWSYHATVIAVAAVLTWRRTAMLWMTVGMALAAIELVVMDGFYAAGWTLKEIGLRWPSVFFPTLGAIMALVLLSQWREADQWKEWRLRTGHIRFLDMILFRHIPDLRSNRI